MLLLPGVVCACYDDNDNGEKDIMIRMSRC